MSPTSPVPPALRALAAHAAALERAAAEHPANARRLWSEAADVWFCLGRTDRAAELSGLLLRGGRSRRRRRRAEPARPRAGATAATVES